jgi:hypothetical protein
MISIHHATRRLVPAVAATSKRAMGTAIKLPDLSYDYGALEPVVSISDNGFGCVHLCHITVPLCCFAQDYRRNYAASSF